jgi:hypothetical protein
MREYNIFSAMECAILTVANLKLHLGSQDQFPEWKSKNAKMHATADDTSWEEWQGKAGSFTGVLDKDDLEYNPFATVAIVCVDSR